MFVLCSYLVSFLLDSTVGLLIIFLLLKAVAWLVSAFDLSPLRSGVYGKIRVLSCMHNVAPCVFLYTAITSPSAALPAGSPFKLHYWLAQTGVYLAVMLLEKLMVGPLIAFSFWRKVPARGPSSSMQYTLPFHTMSHHASAYCSVWLCLPTVFLSLCCYMYM